MSINIQTTDLFLKMSERYFPQAPLIIGGVKYPVDQMVQEYRLNGYDKEKVDRIAYQLSELRMAMGSPRADETNFADAELFWALRTKGISVNDGEIVLRRRVLLPEERSESHFIKNGPVVVFLDTQMLGLIGKDRFIEATVTIVLEGRVDFTTKREWFDESKISGSSHSLDNPALYHGLGGKNGWAYLNEPSILRPEEYELLSSPDQAKLWLMEIRSDCPEIGELRLAICKRAGIPLGSVVQNEILDKL